MSVEIVKGNAVDALLNVEIDYLLHVANCQGVMGSGIAKEIKQKVPEAFRAYKKYESPHGLELGTISSGGQVVNLHAQEYYGYDGNRYLDYEALALCLEKVRNCLKAHPVACRIGLPLNMGCDRAGGEWSIVLSMIEHYLEGYQVKIFKLK